MVSSNANINISSFYPETYFEILNCSISESSVVINLKSKRQDCICPSCHQTTNLYHGTYTRKVQDLPILGKKTTLNITAHEYECKNDNCSTKTLAETFDSFIGYYGRFTERCEDFITMLALETSCEGASRICNHMGIHISGDTIIRILKKRFAAMNVEATNDYVGIDDFSTKKGQSYCTVVCNADSHIPIAILDGRDGSSLREWLKENKHIKGVTRDRASAYAKVINNELPDAMQIADRFHLHQNLFEVIKKCVSNKLPHNIVIETKDQMDQEANPLIESIDSSTICHDDSKKNATRCG